MTNARWRDVWFCLACCLLASCRQEEVARDPVEDHKASSSREVVAPRQARDGGGPRIVIDGEDESSEWIEPESAEDASLSRSVHSIYRRLWASPCVRALDGAICKERAGGMIVKLVRKEGGRIAMALEPRYTPCSDALMAEFVRASACADRELASEFAKFPILREAAGLSFPVFFMCGG